jgi:hypothetical protein
MVKCTLVQALRLCTGRTAHRGSKGIDLPFLDHGTRRGWGVSVTHRPLFTPGKDPLPIVQEAGWTPGPVSTGAKNLAHTGIRSPDRPARNQLLYRLSYPSHFVRCVTQNFTQTGQWMWKVPASYSVHTGIKAADIWDWPSPTSVYEFKYVWI